MVMSGRPAGRPAGRRQDPVADREQPAPRGEAATATTGPARTADEGRSDWWWPAVCGVVALVAVLAAAVGPLAHPAAAVVVGAAVVSAPYRPRGVMAVASVGALAGITVAALAEQAAPLAGVAVAAAAAQLALSPGGKPRLVAAGLLVATVAGALALRSSGPPTIGGPLDDGAAVGLAVAALAAAVLALPAHGGAPALATAAAPTAALAVSALGLSLGVGGGGGGLGVTGAGATLGAAAAVLAAVALGLVRRPAAALVAAALACAATPAFMAAPLALAAAAVAAALAVPWPRRPSSDSAVAAVADRPPPAWGLGIDRARPDDDSDERDQSGGDRLARPVAAAAYDEPHPVAAPVPAWAVGLAAVPAVAVALDTAAGRSPAAVLAVVALVAAVTLPVLRPPAEAGAGRHATVPAGAWPAIALAAALLVLPGRVGWFGGPLPHWPVGVGFAAIGAAVALLPRGRPRAATSGASAVTATPTASEPAPAPAPAPASAMGAGAAEPERRKRRRRRDR